MRQIINTALGPRMARVEGKLDALMIREGVAGATSTPPSFADDTSELAEQLARALAEDRVVLPPGTSVGCTTTIEHVVRPGGFTSPSPTVRATRVQLRDGGTFTPRELLETGMMDKSFRWRGPR